MTDNTNLIRVLINCSEKAANIARVCRSNEELLALLVQEKTGSDANQRFEHDFKTLADVLIQETIKHDVCKLFPALREAILGEESTHFTNKMGQAITIAVGDNEAETSACLQAVLDGHEEAADALASEVHKAVNYDQKLDDIPELPSEELDFSNLGIWIDPIDATSEYISGDTIFTDFPGITSTGLDCVTVLIGVYERDTGVPVIGIVMQPFGHKLDKNEYTSSLYWGVCLPSIRAHNCSSDATVNKGHPKIGIFSTAEKGDILQKFLELNFELAFSAGAGHKALKVISNEADVYFLSKGTTFRWDICGPQAILRALGGDVYDYAVSVRQQMPVPIKYIAPEADQLEFGSDWKRNANGIIAVRDVTVLKEILSKFSVN